MIGWWIFFSVLVALIELGRMSILNKSLGWWLKGLITDTIFIFIICLVVKCSYVVVNS